MTDVGTSDRSDVDKAEVGDVMNYTSVMMGTETAMTMIHIVTNTGSMAPHEPTD
jgi:hypothetical protein